MLLTAGRPCPSVRCLLRHCSEAEGSAGEAGSRAAVADAAGEQRGTAGDKLDVWRLVSFQQAAQPPNPNTASSSA